MSWLTSFFSTVSFLGVTDLFAAASTTNVVFVLLASKPAFIAAAFLTGYIAYSRLDRRQLTTDHTDTSPDRQLHD
jgi:hypothetical protein